LLDRVRLASATTNSPLPQRAVKIREDCR
jgi:hypothetical protein